MLRMFMLFLFLVILMGSPTVVDAQSSEETVVTAPAEGLSFDDVVQDYYESLILRPDVTAHREALNNLLNDYDGRIIAEEFLDSDYYSMLWSAEIQNVVILKNGEEITIDRSTDEDGRPAFESEDISGWLDVSGDRLHVHIADSISDLGIWWMGEIVVSSTGANENIPLPAIGATRKKCICKGSKDQLCSGGDSDCQENQPCAINGVNSTCIFAGVPVPAPDPGPCGNFEFTTFIPTALFAPLVGLYWRKRKR